MSYFIWFYNCVNSVYLYILNVAFIHVWQWLFSVLIKMSKRVCTIRSLFRFQFEIWNWNKVRIIWKKNMPTYAFSDITLLFWLKSVHSNIFLFLNWRRCKSFEVQWFGIFHPVCRWSTVCVKVWHYCTEHWQIDFKLVTLMSL